MFRRIFSHEIKFERQTSVANVKGTLHPLTAPASQPKPSAPCTWDARLQEMEGALVHLRCQASAADFRKTGGASLALAIAKKADKLHGFRTPLSAHLFTTTTNRHRSSANNSTKLRPFSTRGPDQVMSSARFCNNVCVTSHGPTANMSSTCTLMQTSNFSCVNRQVSCSS